MEKSNYTESISYLVKILVKKNVKEVIICPGSRNAPLSLSFVRNTDINTRVIIDERSAAFYALGIAQKSRFPVAIVCTSGTATLNFAPAIAEAYYQQIPLLILTADRPEELIGQGDGQMINQRDIYANYIRASYTYPISDGSLDTLNFQERITIEACNTCMYPTQGPVHINIPLREPLYNHNYTTELEGRDTVEIMPEKTLSSNDIAKLSAEWNKSSKVMILVGQHNPSDSLQNALSSVAEQKQAVVLCESISNLHNSLFHECIDRTLGAMPNEVENYTPELLITVGYNLVSRRIKTLLKKHSPKHHWHISTQQIFPDPFGSLNYKIFIDEATLFNIINPHIYNNKHTNYIDLWKTLENEGELKHKEFLNKTPYSDLKVFDIILHNIPINYEIQLGNSSPVRYAQLFNRGNQSNFSNRGTSGIDGSVSTACGASLISENPTLLICGDLSFFYDSNALLNNNFPNNLKIIVVNNGGGGIFRYIPGSSEQKELSYIFEGAHSFSVENIVKAFNINYMRAQNEIEVTEKVKQLLSENNKASVLEIFTPREINGEVLKDYFKYLKSDLQI